MRRPTIPLPLHLLLLAVLASGAMAATVEPGFGWLRFAGEYQRAIAGEAAGAWKQVPWCADAADAAAEARRAGKPLLVFVYVTLDALRVDGNGHQICPGGRATRGTSLSDPAVIARLRSDFVCLALDCRRDGFPASMPGLRLCERIYRGYADRDRGFSVSCALTPDGQHLLGSSGIGTVATYRDSICYDPAKFARFLDESAARVAPWSTADAAGRVELDREVWRSLMATTTPAGFVEGP